MRRPSFYLPASLSLAAAFLAVPSAVYAQDAATVQVRPAAITRAKPTRAEAGSTSSSANPAWANDSLWLHHPSLLARLYPFWLERTPDSDLGSVEFLFSGSVAPLTFVADSPSSDSPASADPSAEEVSLPEFKGASASALPVRTFVSTPLFSLSAFAPRADAWLAAPVARISAQPGQSDAPATRSASASVLSSHGFASTGSAPASTVVHQLAAATVSQPVTAAIAPQPEAAGGSVDVNDTRMFPGATLDAIYDTVNVSTTANGTINHSSGTFTVTSALNLGVTTGRTGTYNLSGTGILMVNDLYLGGIDTVYDGTGVGVFTQGGTSTVTATDGINLGSASGTLCTYTLNAGTVTTPYLIVGDAGPATFTQTGGTVTVQSTISQGFQLGGQAGTYQLNGGTLTVPVVYAFTSSAVPVNAGTFNFNGGILQTNAANTTFMQGLLAANVQTNGAKVDTNGFNITIVQPLLHSGGVGVADGGLTKQTGAGTLTLSGANTYTGPTAVNVGTLQAGVASVAGTSGAFGLNSAVTLANTAGVALALNGFSTQIGSLTGGGSNGGNVTLGSATLSVGSDNTSPAAYAGVISGMGALTKIGTGTLTLSGTNTYSGGTNVQAGRLIESNNGNAIPAGTVAISSGATLELNVATAGTTISQAGVTAFTGTGSLIKTGAGTFAFGGNGGNVNISLGAGALVDVQAGTLRGSSSNQGFFTNNLAGLNVAAGATFNGVESTAQFDALTGAGSVVGGFQGTNTTTVGVNGGSGTFTGVIGNNTGQAGLLALTKTGAGTQTLSGTSTYTGATTISGGTLAVNNDGTAGSGRLQNTPSMVINNGGTLLLSGSNLNTDRLNNAANVSVNGGGKFSTGARSEGTAPVAAGGAGGAAGLGALTLANTTTTSRATIDFGSTANGSALVFTSLAAIGKGAYVSIIGLSGTANVDGGALTNDRLLFVNDPGFTLTDLANWQFSNDTGTNFALGGREISYNGYYEIVPVPEPATWLGGALLLGACVLLPVVQQRMRRTAD